MSSTRYPASEASSPAITRRPIRDAPMTPTVRASAPTRSVNGGHPCAYPAAADSAPLAAKVTAASVKATTGPAFASAADETTMPRSHTASVTIGLTEPAAWTTARSSGACARTSGVSGGHSHPVSRISVRARTSGAAPPVRGPDRTRGARSTHAASRSRSSGVNIRSATSAPIARAALTGGPPPARFACCACSATRDRPS
ncbi:hypothetical protein SALBM135S_00697 [Streptomyces alboniger]